MFGRFISPARSFHFFLNSTGLRFSTATLHSPSSSNCTRELQTPLITHVKVWHRASGLLMPAARAASHVPVGATITVNLRKPHIALSRPRYPLSHDVGSGGTHGVRLSLHFTHIECQDPQIQNCHRKGYGRSNTNTWTWPQQFNSITSTWTDHHGSATTQEEA